MRKKVQAARSSTFSEAQSPLFPSAVDQLLKTHKTVRIAVSGDVHLTELETAIINTGEFQRLRRIKELGTTYLVYPSATHTRFEHSLGTLAVSQQMIKSIRDNTNSEPSERTIAPEDEILTRLLALVHDISHIPFGHTLEDEFCVLPRHDQNGWRRDHFLGPESAIGSLLIQKIGQELYNEFYRIISVRKDQLDTLHDKRFVYDIVNNTVCADLLDYLSRDSYFCNLDLRMNYRFLNFLYLAWDRDRTCRHLVVRLWKRTRGIARRDIVNELIRLLDNRYLLGERVYYHHAKLIAGAMVAGAVQRAVQADKLNEKDLVGIGDDELLMKLQSIDEDSCDKLASSVRDRVLWKEVFNKNRGSILQGQSHSRHMAVVEGIRRNWWLDAGARRREEDLHSTLLGMASGDLLVHCPGPDMSKKLAQMMVLWNGDIQPLCECRDDTLIGSRLKVIEDSHDDLWGIRVFYNPAYKDRVDDIEKACDSMINYDPDKSEAAHRAFYEVVVRRFVEMQLLHHDMTAASYVERFNDAVTRLCGQTSSDREYNTVEQVIKDAFRQ